LNGLAHAYAAAKKFEQTLALHEQMVKLRKAKLGLEHADTLSSMHELARA
jgi:hypothetical protein